MNLVTYNNIRLKCYLKLFTCFTIVLNERGSSNVLANAIDNFNPFFKQLKKFYLFLATYSVMSSITISLIVLCFLAAIIFRSVFNSSSIVICNFVSLIFYSSIQYIISTCSNICKSMYLYYYVGNNKVT